jgi:ferritin
MDKDVISLIDESINLELYVADLYSLFYNFFPEDANFWWRLLLEEQNHAALIRSVKECFEPIGELPHGILAPFLRELKDMNSKLSTLIKEYKYVSPPRDVAFNIALELEESAGELHFQKFMEQETSSDIGEILKQLNKDDKDHADRIRSYMESHGIRCRSGIAQ